MSDALNNGAATESNTSFRPALQLMCGRAAAFAVTFLIPVLLSIIFDKVEFGTYKQVFLFVYSIYGIGQMGMAECLLYFLPSFPEAAGRYFMNSMLMLFTTGLAEATETLAVFAAFCLWPDWFAAIAYGFAAICLYTALSRIVHAARVFGGNSE